VKKMAKEEKEEKISRGEQAWTIQGVEGIDIDRLLDLYKKTLDVKNEAVATRIAAEALASESTAFQNTALESTAFIAAQAVSRLVKSQ
jgi:formate-dependent phosphoribosylglycinamide formyltransferase (GAR transformylase)